MALHQGSEVDIRPSGGRILVVVQGRPASKTVPRAGPQWSTERVEELSEDIALRWRTATAC